MTDSGEPSDAASEVGEDAATAELTHVEDGAVDMVGVGDKPAVRRRAVAAGRLELRPETVAAVREGTVGKGEVLAVARVGAIQAVKRTSESIPLCHAIPITDVDTDFGLSEDGVELRVTVETVARTGPEMEALQGVTTGLNVVWDMVKSAEKVDGRYSGTRVTDVRVLEKSKTDGPGDTDARAK